MVSETSAGATNTITNTLLVRRYSGAESHTLIGPWRRFSQIPAPCCAAEPADSGVSLSCHK
jgi:hypothetical protein